MEIVYTAHTESGVFMLDAEGVCRWAVAHPGRTQENAPERIVGAQYVATLDLHAPGALVDLPRIGCPMLFAVADESGCIRLLRTPPVLRFEDRRATIRPGLPFVPPPAQSFTALPPPPPLPRATPLPRPLQRAPARLPPPPRIPQAMTTPPPPVSGHVRSPSGIRPANRSIDAHGESAGVLPARQPIDAHGESAGVLPARRPIQRLVRGG